LATGKGLYVVTVSVSTELAAVGRWNQSVLLDRVAIEKLLQRRREATVRLTLAGKRLSIDRTLIDVSAVGDQACPFRSLTAMPADRPPYQLPLFRPNKSERKRPSGDISSLPLFR